MGKTFLASDLTDVRTEYGVLLPNGKVVKNTYDLDKSLREEVTKEYSNSTASSVDSASELAEKINTYYEKVGAVPDARPVTREVITTYSDWVGVE